MPRKHGPTVRYGMTNQVPTGILPKRDRGARLDTPPPAYNYITPREMDIVKLLAKGHNGKEIAYELGVSPATVKQRIKTASDRLCLHTWGDSRIRLVNWYREYVASRGVVD